MASNLIADMARSIGVADMARSIGMASLPTLKRAAGAVTRFVPFPQPVLLVGVGSSARLGQSIADFGHRRLLVVTDKVITQLGLAEPMLAALRGAGTEYVVFDEVRPDAPIADIENGIARYKSEGCDAIVAFGGGSVLDSAKVIGMAVANRKKPAELAGYFRGRSGPPPLYAVPTTAGTGSEVTVAAVISDPKASRKLVVADTRIVPDMVALDPSLMAGLPPPITAATGMDALTHAVEAYIGSWATPYTDRLALAAVGMIWKALPAAFDQGSDLKARETMALASTYAGMAFTRANVGNVHAIAHQLGAHYHVPHGLANAIMLPGVLRFSLPEARRRLAQLGRRIGLEVGGEAARAAAFCDAVQAMNDRLGIPRQVASLLEKDLPVLVSAACDEADKNYPVPRKMSPTDCETLLREVMPAPAPKAAARPKASAAQPPAAGKRAAPAAVARRSRA